MRGSAAVGFSIKMLETSTVGFYLPMKNTGLIEEDSFLANTNS